MTETLQSIAALPIYAVGWLVGIIARIGAFIRAALTAGYRRGRGA